jgi:putative phosphoribosyl transferase
LPPPPIIPSRPIDFFVRDALDELAARERLCRAGRSAMDLTDKSVILVDCGMRTGSTMKAAVGALRTLKPARVIAAVPIAAPESRDEVAASVDDLVCLDWPEPFGHTGLWYKDFRRPGDDALGALLADRRP